MTLIFSCPSADGIRITLAKNRHNLCLLFVITSTEGTGVSLVPFTIYCEHSRVLPCSGATGQTVIPVLVHLHFQILTDLLTWSEMEGSPLVSKHKLHNLDYIASKAIPTGKTNIASVHIKYATDPSAAQQLCLNILFRKRCCNISERDSMCRCSHISQLEPLPDLSYFVRLRTQSEPSQTYVMNLPNFHAPFYYNCVRSL